ncbi:hypothetical protein ACHAWT_001199 [Skeletonema menzelii]|mmetsp:Transcript_23990/g.39554  ORF Transcript_23990/g.39554 Transcript_23990/m.39554 type:complete len:298 (-) Transcript_23990:199-1092(-)
MIKMRHQIVFVLLAVNFFHFGKAFALPATKGPILEKSRRRQLVINQPVQLSMSASFSADGSNIMLSEDDAVKKRVVVATTLAGTAAVTGLFLNHHIISQAVLTALRAYEGSLVKNPLRTKVMTGATLAAFGDYLAQMKEMKETNREYNVPRALSFAAFDSCYRMFQHAAIPFIVMLGQGHAFHSLLSSIPFVTMSESSLAFTAAMERTFMYQFALIPFFYYPIFFTFTGLMQGLNLKETFQRAKKSFLPCWTRNLIFWIPTQMIMFGLINENWQIPFVCVMGILWSMILSVVAGKAS